MPATSTNPTGAVEVARSFFAAYNAHDVGRMVAACGEDARLRYVPMGDHGHGKVREVGQAIWSGLIDAFPDLAVTVQSAFGDELHAAAEVTMGGRSGKTSSGSPAGVDITNCRTRSSCAWMTGDRSPRSPPTGTKPASIPSSARRCSNEPRAARSRRPRAADAGPIHRGRRMDESIGTGGTQWPVFGAPRRLTAGSRRKTPVRCR